MRLAELKPEWRPVSEETKAVAGYENVDACLDFQCPSCPRDADGDSSCGGLLLPVTRNRTESGRGWGWNGEEDFEKVTLTPSIWHHCKSDPHFFIQEGGIVFA